MTETYDPEQSTLRDQVRGLIADAGPERFYLQDEEIQAAINRCSDSLYEAAAECARAIGARFAQAAVTVSEPGTTLSGRDTRARLYYELADTLEARARRQPAMATSDWHDPDLKRIHLDLGQAGELLDTAYGSD